jgi:hypothetical protein
VDGKAEHPCRHTSLSLTGIVRGPPSDSLTPRFCPGCTARYVAVSHAVDWSPISSPTPKLATKDDILCELIVQVTM